MILHNPRLAWCAFCKRWVFKYLAHICIGGCDGSPSLHSLQKGNRREAKQVLGAQGALPEVLPSVD